MSVLNLSGDEAPECPLCMEFFELDDINFYPCTCGYQICRFCWNKLRTEGNGLCPACRTPYTENPADFKPLTSEEMAKIKAEKRQKDQAKKQKITENRKHLANVRVVQKNLVFVVGLSPRLADPEILKKPDYFGKFGKIHKVVINHSTQYAGSQLQGPSASAYVTYLRSEDALRAIQAVNNIFIDGRTLKASLGTTKYCSHFMKNQTCPKSDCMYLHEMGDEHASFTKEQMQQGKHTEYEKALHEEMLNSYSQQPPSPVSPELGGEGVHGVGDGGEWAGHGGHWGSTPRVQPDHWGGDDWANGGTGNGNNGDQSWPDLGGNMPSYKGRFISNNSKEEHDKSKSKSCSSSDCDSSSYAADRPGSGPGTSDTGHTVGLADAAWDDTGRETPAPAPALLTQEPEPEIRHEPSGWLDNDLKSSTTFLDDDVDDLGFDPFHETQKGLADLLESEAAAQAQQHQAKVSSPSPDWRSQTQGPAAPSRVKLPPPGFHNSSATAQHLQPNNLGGSYNHGGYGGPGPVSSNAVDSLFGLGGGRHRSGGAPGFGAQSAGQEIMFGLGGHKSGACLDLGGSQNRLGLGGLGLGDRMYGGGQEQKHNPLLGQHLGQDNGFASKDWQDGLRALLPNVNVSFGVGGGPGGQTGLGGGLGGQSGLGAGLGGQSGLGGGLGSQSGLGGGPGGQTGHFGLQNMHQPSFSQPQQQERPNLQHNTNWGSGLSNGLGNDWTMLDPAIVSGQLANNLDHQAPVNHLGRPDSPAPNWITANLEQLTEPGAAYSSQNNLIPAFNGLGLGDRLGGRQGRGGWGGVASTATPPPGFSHHRQNLGQHYQGFAGINKGSEAHKIGEF